MRRIMHLIAAAAWSGIGTPVVGYSHNHCVHYCQAHLCGYLSEDGANNAWFGEGAEFAIKHRAALLKEGFCGG